MVYRTDFPRKFVCAQNHDFPEKCHEMSRNITFLLYGYMSPPGRPPAAATPMFAQQDLQALERLTWRLPDINFSENSFPQMDLCQFQFWSDEMAENVGQPDNMELGSSGPKFLPISSDQNWNWPKSISGKLFSEKFMSGNLHVSHYKPCKSCCSNIGVVAA